MSKKLGEFRELAGLDGVWVADDGALRCIALELVDGNLCLFNPVKGLSEKVVGQLQALGRVKYLLSPNFYHNRAFSEYSGQFNKALLCASAGARARLQEVTDLKFVPPTRLQRVLPKHISLIDTQGLKTGELWLRIKSQESVFWLVGDAFCGPKSKDLSIFSTSPELLKPFPKFGVGDKAQYTAWVDSQIEADQPMTVVPCHGAMIRSPTLPKKLRLLVSNLS